MNNSSELNAFSEGCRAANQSWLSAIIYQFARTRLVTFSSPPRLMIRLINKSFNCFYLQVLAVQANHRSPEGDCSMAYVSIFQDYSLAVFLIIRTTAGVPRVCSCRQNKHHERNEPKPLPPSLFTERISRNLLLLGLFWQRKQISRLNDAAARSLSTSFRTRRGGNLNRSGKDAEWRRWWGSFLSRLGLRLMFFGEMKHEKC